MKLLGLKLRNFKGAKDITILPDGKSAEIYGDNGTCKTTLYDGMCWLLFDKDSKFNSRFEIKTINLDGTQQSGLEHEVEGVFSLEGSIITLRKVYKEIWTKKRGQPLATFTGHKTEHFIDDVPVKKNEYKTRAEEIAPEEQFKLLSSPFHFASGLHWIDRRETLLNVCGDVTDAQVIKKNAALEGLPMILGERLMADHKKVVTARRQEINRELTAIPIRIDEVTRAMPDTSGIDVKALQSDIPKLEKELLAFEKQKLQLESGGGAAKKQEELDEVNRQIKKREGDFQQTQDETIRGLQQKVNSAKDQIGSNLQKSDRFMAEANTANDKAQAIEDELPKIRERWHELNGSPIDDTEEFCDKCSQVIPLKNKKEARVADLATINDFGLQQKAVAKGHRESANDFLFKVKEMEAANKALNKVISDLDKKIAEVREMKFTADAKLAMQKEALEKEIATMKTGDNSEEIAKKEKLIEETHDLLAGQKANLLKVREAAESEKRIEELKDQEKLLAKEYEKLQQEVYLMEQFTKTKVEMLEAKINKKFKLAKFKLFKQNVDGGIEDCCEVLFNGVPFSSGLNHGAQITVGCDIINTLQQHYKTSVPLFIDNREAITGPIKMDGQVISLIVSEKDKELRVHTI